MNTGKNTLGTKKIAMLLFILILLTSCTGNEEKQEQNNSQNIIKNQAIEINNIVEDKNKTNIEVISGLEEELEIFNTIYKEALLSTGKGNEKAKEQVKSTLEKWNKIELNYLGKKINGFENTNNLDSKLSNIGNYIREADIMVSNGELSSAHEKLEHVRKELKQIRQENQINNISDQMLIVHDIMEEIVEHSEEKNTAKYNEIQEGINNLKILNVENDEYKKMVGDFENILNELLQLDGEEYNNKIKELKPAFIKMYMMFG